MLSKFWATFVSKFVATNVLKIAQCDHTDPHPPSPTIENVTFPANVRLAN